MLLQRLALTSAICVLAGCGGSIGQSATSGALGQLRETSEEIQADGGPAAFSTMAGNAVKGGLTTLDDPEHQAQLDRIVATATESAMSAAIETLKKETAHGGGPIVGEGNAMTGFGSGLSTGLTLGMSRQLQLELGANGDGPLGQSVTALTERVSQAAVAGVEHELIPADPECAGPNHQRCVQQRAYDLSRSAATGFADGIARAFRLPLLVIAFAAGLLVAFLIHLVMRRRGGTSGQVRT